MVSRRAGTSILFRYALLGLVALAAVYLGGGLVQRVQVRQQREEELQRLQAETALAQQQAADLEEHREFAQSPEAVEAWARENGWARPEEVSVILVGPEGEAAAPGEETPGARVEPASARDAWWDLFFDNR